MRYHCRFKRAGREFYGKVDEYADEAKELAKQGKVVVVDAVTGVPHAVRNEDVVDLPSDLAAGKWIPEGYWWGGGEDEDFVVLAQIAHQVAEARLPKDKRLRPGHMFAIGVADGHASYVVVSVKNGRAKVEWRGWCLDAWTDHHFGWGGTFPAKDVARYVRPGAKDPFGKAKTAEELSAILRKLALEFARKYGRDPLPLVDYAVPKP